MVREPLGAPGAWMGSLLCVMAGAENGVTSKQGAATFAAVRRVSVVGTSGSGKSTLGAALAAKLGVDFLELDSVFHQADWEPLPTPEFRRRVAAVAAGEG